MATPDQIPTDLTLDLGDDIAPEEFVAAVRNFFGYVMGLFVTLAPPTKPMETEAAASGFWETNWGQVPRVQILTIDQLLSGAAPRIPMSRPDAFKKPEKEDRSSQGELGI